MVEENRFLVVLNVRCQTRLRRSVVEGSTDLGGTGDVGDTRSDAAELQVGDRKRSTLRPS